MRKLIVTVAIGALVALMAMSPNEVSATTRDQAEALCEKNSRCETMERSDRGSMYCVRQPDGSCKVVVCPTGKDCYVWRTQTGKSRKAGATAIDLPATAVLAR